MQVDVGETQVIGTLDQCLAALRGHCPFALAASICISTGQVVAPKKVDEKVNGARQSA